MSDKKNDELFVRFIERFRENSLDAIPNKGNREAFLDNLNAAATGFSQLLDKNGDVAPEKIKNLTSTEKKALRDRLDYNKDGYITDQELATLRDYTRIAPGMQSANSDITKIRESLQSAGIDLGTAPQKPLTDSFGTKIEGGFAPKKLTVREVFLASNIAGDGHWKRQKISQSR